jgi:hypothetical protein
MKLRKMGWMGHATCIRDMRNAHILVGKLEGKRQTT